MNDKKELEIKEVENEAEKVKTDMMWKEIAKECGSNSKELGKMIFHQLLDSKIGIFEISSSIKEIAPKDHIEGMLAAQMIATHHAVMNCYRLAVESRTFDIMNNVYNSANKLTRTYTMQMEALNRHRGKGQQKMTVEHVHVNSGGQAIIGNVNTIKENKE